MPIPPAMKTYSGSVSSGSAKSPFGCSTSTSAPTGSSTSDFLNAVSRIRVASPSTPCSVGDITHVMWRRAPLSSLYGGFNSSTQKYCPGRYSTSSPCRSNTTMSVSRATSTLSLMSARTGTNYGRRPSAGFPHGGSAARAASGPPATRRDRPPPARAAPPPQLPPRARVAPLARLDRVVDERDCAIELHLEEPGTRRELARLPVTRL